MDTSKNYYDSVMRDFQTYGRGCTLEQHYRDETCEDETAVRKYRGRI